MRYVDWLHALSELSDKGVSECPSCGSSRLRHCFAGSEASRMGYGVLWCEECRRGVQLSRLKVPDDFEILGTSDYSLALAVLPPIEWLQ